MDRVPDGGIGWRQKLIHDLKDLKINWLNPCCKPIDIGVEDLESRAARNYAKQMGDFGYVQTQMQQICPVDLRMVDISDLLIVNLDLAVHATGSYEELFRANNLGKPILVRIEQGIEHTPDWLLGRLPLEMLFSTWDQVKTYVRHIAHDPVIDRLNRWFFFNYTGEYPHKKKNSKH
jgi:hypothetical protein